MDSHTLSEYQVFTLIEPVGDRRRDLQAAIAAGIGKVSELMIDWDEDLEESEIPLEEKIHAAMAAIAEGIKRREAQAGKPSAG
jgi:histidinol phosphatase-like enzyme